MLPPSIQMEFYLQKHALENNIPYIYLRRCAELETTYLGPHQFSYNPFVKSKAGALGPMQVMPSTALRVWKGSNIKNTKQIKHRLQYDINFNIATSAKYLRLLYKKHKNWTVVFSIYNQGTRGQYNINYFARYITKRQ